MYQTSNITNNQIILIIEFKAKGISIKNYDKRIRLQDRITDTLRRTGLGSCDGGGIGGGIMDVCCFVSEFDVAKKIIEEDLKGTEFADYSRIYEDVSL